MAEQRLKGQEVSIRIIEAGNVVESIDSISTFNDATKLEIKEAGYLGETVNRFDEILNGYGGNFEFHVRKAAWSTLIRAITDRAQRRRPELVFNIIRTDLFPNGESNIITYIDVAWGEVPQTIGGRGEYVKVAMSFSCGERSEQINQLP